MSQHLRSFFFIILETARLRELQAFQPLMFFVTRLADARSKPGHRLHEHLRPVRRLSLPFGDVSKLTQAGKQVDEGLGGGFGDCLHLLTSGLHTHIRVQALGLTT